MARSLAAANITKAIRNVEDDGPTQATSLLPGHMGLWRFWQPSLLPGTYEIEAQQVITSTVGGETSKKTVFNYATPTTTNLSTDPDNPNAPIVPQKFNVIAPQFNLDPKLVNSLYPPPGHTDEGLVLPHIVFNDPHLPWDRDVRTRLEFLGPDGVYDAPPFLPPWIALAVFDVDDLALSPADLTALGLPSTSTSPQAFTNPPQVGQTSSQVSSPGAYAMSVGDYLTEITSRLDYEAHYIGDEWTDLLASTDRTAIIFPKKDLVKTVFQPSTLYGFMSHVRQVSVAGLPDTGDQGDQYYSVCISRRTGPITPATSTSPALPVTQVVHLVSLEAVDNTDMTVAGSSDRVGMVSLYSWTYLSVPPNPVNFKATMTHLADELQMLQPSEQTLKNLKSSITIQPSTNLQAAAQHLYDRLSRGYTISRWRTAVGQETVAFTRGPLTPVTTPWKPSIANDWPGSSNTGKEFQILDKDIGVMDVSYSSAWQLGKLLAVTDNVFNSALLRFRSLIHETAASQTRKIVNGIALKKALLGNIAQTVKGIHSASDGTRAPARIVLPSSDRVAPPLSDPSVARVFVQQLQSVIDVQVAAGEKIYTDYTLGQANNSDWEIIHKWISDKLFLGGIPAHYLIPDPALLPSEALRFFHIDNAWMDCFIDGALSVSNHLEPVDDKVRRRMKDVYNVYLANNIESLPIKPPVPRYGFFIRSALIQVMPDIRITVVCRTGTAPNIVADNSRQPLVRLTKMDDFTILALLDCLPEEIMSITFAQPPHQQRYVAGTTLTPPTFEVKDLFTQDVPASGIWPLLNPQPTTDEMAKWYDAPSRCLQLEQMYTYFKGKLASSHFKSPIDSTVFALELNDASYQIEVLPPTISSPPTVAPQPRQLWVGTDVNDPDDPIAPAEAVTTPSSSRGHIQKPADAPITRHPQPTIRRDILPAPLLNLSSRAITTHPSSISPRSTFLSPLQDTTPAPTLTPQYTLAIHPDYRGAAPQPHIDSTSGTKTYSSHDYIPTGTNGLFNLIISLSRVPTALPALVLVSLIVTIPIVSSQQSSSSSTTEPLLSSAAGTTAHMLANKRLFISLGQINGSGSSTLTITLTTRTSNSSVFLIDIAEAGFRLTRARIAPIVAPTMVNVMGETAAVSRGVCKVGLLETYASVAPGGGTMNVATEWDVLKRNGGDVDGSGAQV